MKPILHEPYGKTQVKIAVIGGGTGSFTMLSALKSYTSRIAAIVGMADDGGSTGVLRDEFGTLPPGDVRQCLVALSDSPEVRDLFDYRFDAGTLEGHSFGNILLTALEKITGDFSQAVATASEILRVNGVVIPATLDDVRLRMEWPEASLVLNSERVIDAEFFQHDPRRATLSLEPAAKVNPAALAAIEQADLVVIAPGDLYTSLGSLLVIDGIGEALAKTAAPVAYVCNLVARQGQTKGFTVSDHADEIERFAGQEILDYVIYNQQMPGNKTIKLYEAEDAYPVEIDQDRLDRAHYQSLPGDYLGDMASPNKADTLPVTRSLIRHDSEAVAKTLMQIYESARRS